MSREIWKYPLSPGCTEISMPMDALLLAIQVQHGVAHVWALVNPSEPFTSRKILTFGTGHPIPDDLSLVFIDTFQLEGGAFVFHAFEQILEGEYP